MILTIYWPRKLMINELFGLYKHTIDELLFRTKTSICQQTFTHAPPFHICNPGGQTLFWEWISFLFLWGYYSRQSKKFNLIYGSSHWTINNFGKCQHIYLNSYRKNNVVCIYLHMSNNLFVHSQTWLICRDVILEWCFKCVFHEL